MRRNEFSTKAQTLEESLRRVTTEQEKSYGRFSKPPALMVALQNPLKTFAKRKDVVAVASGPATLIFYGLTAWQIQGYRKIAHARGSKIRRANAEEP